MDVRAAKLSELSVLQDIERAAGYWFRDVDMAAITEDEPLPLPELARYQQAGRAWVIADTNDTPVAYLIADIVDGNLYIAQISVHPNHARHGLGSRLLEHLAQYAIANHIPALTLTTFTHVAWNAPYYARCGFHTLADSDLTSGLRRIRQQEAAHGLDRWSRVCMRRDL
jgi:GNAT superfamily N-acetyltransferase